MTRRPDLSFISAVGSFRLFCGMAGLASILGCGQQVYEQRLAESAKYFSYVQRIDSSVGPAWKNTAANPGPVEQLRVPLQFTEVRKPVPVKNAETGEMVEPEVDPRQPDYVGLTFPGLVATWEAKSRVVVDGQSTMRKTYLYVLTNAYMFSSADESRRAPEFVRTLLAQLAEKLSIKPLDVVTDAQREQYPRAQPFYVAQKTYDVFRIPEAFVIDGAPYSLEMYVQHAGPIDALLLLAIPVGIESSEKLSERIPAMLETFKVSSRPPLPGAKPGSSGAGSGAKSTGF